MSEAEKLVAESSSVNKVFSNRKFTSQKERASFFDDWEDAPEARVWSIEHDRIESIVRSMSPRGIDGRLYAGYTYLGQFITHEIVRDSDACRESESPRGLASSKFNLDSVYFSDVASAKQKGVLVKGRFFLPFIAKMKDVEKYDLFRVNDQAQIPDLRNDENLIIAQLHVLVLQLHNILVDVQSDSMVEQGGQPTEVDYDRFYEYAKNCVVLIMQKVVVKDFLKVILDPAVYDLYFNLVSANGTRRPYKGFYYSAGQSFSIPIEFSHAAFRFGHSMVRSSYHLSHRSDALKTISEIRRNQSGKPLELCELINWQKFFRLSDKSGLRTHTARYIDLNVASGFEKLKAPIRKLWLDFRTHNKQKRSPRSTEEAFAFDQFRRSIIVKDIEASEFTRSGSDMLILLASEKFQKIYQKLNLPNLSLFEAQIQYSSGFVKSVTGSGVIGDFNIGQSPLWMFFLQEASKLPGNDQTKLGPTGSVIVAEVLGASIYSNELNDETKELKSKLGGLNNFYASWSKQVDGQSFTNLINYIIDNYQHRF